jgi:hypothetical protein
MRVAYYPRNVSGLDKEFGKLNGLILENLFQIPEKEEATWAMSAKYGGRGIWFIPNSLILVIVPFAM